MRAYGREGAPGPSFLVGFLLTPSDLVSSFPRALLVLPALLARTVALDIPGQSALLASVALRGAKVLL